MPLRLILLTVCALGGCAALSPPALPTCDGSARRPANPHGSILLQPPVPAVAGEPRPVEAPLAGDGA